MQFQVPQFLDVEDKIIGPLTIKQFLYILGGLGSGYLVFHFVPWIALGLLPAVACVAFGLALAFYTYNKKPLIYYVEAGFHYYKNDRLYVWKRREKKEDPLDLSNFKSTKHSGIGIPTSSGSKLGDLTWSMEVEQKDVTTQKVHSDK